MRTLFWIGLIVLVLGIASFFVPVPHSERHGIKAGDISIGVQTRSEERVPVYVSIILLAGGISMMVVSARTKA